MRIGEVLKSARVLGRNGYDLQRDSDCVVFANMALRRLAVDAEPMALLSSNSLTDTPLVWLDKCYFIKEPQTIEEADLANNVEIVLDSMLFEAFVYAILTEANPDNEYFKKQYTFFANRYRESVFNDGLRKAR